MCIQNNDNSFSNSLIIHAALTQPEHLILVRWMSLEIQWKSSWKYGRVWNQCLKLFETRVNLHIDKATKTRSDKQLRFNHTFYEANIKPKSFTANVECNGTVIELPKTEKPIRFLNFKFSLNGGALVFWFSFNFAVADFWPKMALTLEILSDQMHTFPRNSAVHTIFLFVASFRWSKSAFCHLLCKATCSLRNDKQAR